MWRPSSESSAAARGLFSWFVTRSLTFNQYTMRRTMLASMSTWREISHLFLRDLG